MTKMYSVTGNTYPAKDVLRKAGFSWDGANKQWIGDEEAKAELARITDVRYSRSNQKAMAGITIESITLPA